MSAHVPSIGSTPHRAENDASLRDRIARLLPAGVAKNLYWEFWPTWAAYIPLVPWFMTQALVHRGCALPLIANGSEPLALLAGESKFAILAKLPAAFTPATACIAAGPAREREAQLELLLPRSEFAFPLILKPDVGCRGQGLRLAHTQQAASAALALHKGATLVQAFDPGPHECGVLYAREPGQKVGTILGITGKRFPFVIGDGKQTVAQLIEASGRLRLQRERFLQRLAERALLVPAFGQRVELAVSGNHCQGTLFYDASHLATPALRARCDWLADHVDGFHYGRFDVRFANEAAFARGEDFRIVELNGLASEPTHAYDPQVSLRDSYAAMARAIAVLYRLGALRRERGATCPTPWHALRMIRQQLATQTSDPLAD